MMEETEAANKWCPFGLRSDGVNSAFNRNTKDMMVTKCFGSNCACWVWVIKDETRYGGPPLPLPKEAWRGRCGLCK